MDVGAEPCVVSEVPAGMVRIFVDDNLVGVPEPAVDVGKVVGGYAEVEASKPEAGWAAATQTPDVGGAKAAGEVSMLPGVVEMVVGVVATSVVSYPVVFIDVWGVGMAGMIDEGAIRCRRRSVVSLGAVSGRGMRSGTARMASAGVLRSYREGDKRSD